MLFACVCLCLFLSSEAQCFSSVQPASSAPEWLKTRKVRVKQSTDLKRAEGNVRLAVGEVLTLHDTSDPFWFLCSKAGGTIRGYVESQVSSDIRMWMEGRKKEKEKKKGRKKKKTKTKQKKSNTTEA